MRALLYLSFVLFWMASMILSKAGVITNDKLKRKGRIMLFAAKKPGNKKVGYGVINKESYKMS